MKYRLALLPALAALALGCGGPARIAEPVEVTGSVTYGGGKPVKDVKLNIYPMDRGLPGSARLGPDGKFAMALVPGKYNYSFEPLDGKMAALRSLPEKYHSPHVDHTIDVAPGKPIDISVK